MSPSSSSTQRKLLQDPDSGQYYVVDLPAEVNLKTFYDPETGKYVQVSVPSLEQNLHQSTSSEIKNSPYASYPRVLPLPASSVAVLKSPSQLSEPAWSVPAGPEPAELPEDGQQDYRYTESVDTQPYTEPASYSYRQDARETQVHLGKDVSPTQNTGIVTLTNLDDFAAEGVSWKMKKQNMPASVFKNCLDRHMHTKAHADLMFVQHFVWISLWFGWERKWKLFMLKDAR